MKDKICILLFSVFVSIAAGSNRTENIYNECESKFVGSLITIGVDLIQQIMEYGSPPLGISALDPIEIWMIPLTFDSKEVSGFFTANEFMLKGISQFTTNDVSSTLDRKSIGARLGTQFSTIDITTYYECDLRLFGLLHLYGNGHASVSIKRLNPKLGSKMGFTLYPDFSMQLEALDFILGFPTVNVIITGLLNNEFMSDLISSQLTDVIMTFLSQHQDMFNKTLSDLLKTLINGVLPKNSPPDAIKHWANQAQFSQEIVKVAGEMIQKEFTKFMKKYNVQWR